MKTSIIRLITVIVTIAVLCASALCFTVTSAAENLLRDNWEALDASQAAAIYYNGGVLSIDASLVVGDARAGQKVTLPAGTYTLTATKTGEPPMSFSAKWQGNEVGEKDNVLVFAVPEETEVTIVAYQYRGTAGTASDITLVAGGTAPSESGETPSESAPTYAPSADGNLIVNGNFDNGLTGWKLMNLNEETAKVDNGALVINAAESWHAAVQPTINGTIKNNTEYTLTYEASGVNNMQVRIHKGDGDGGGASITAEPGKTTFTTEDLSSSANFYVIIEYLVNGEVSGTFDNFMLVEGDGTTPPTPTQSQSVPSQSESTPSQSEPVPSTEPTEPTTPFIPIDDPTATGVTPTESGIVAPSGTETGAQPSETGVVVLAGDANGDNAVNMKDVLIMRKFLADMAPAGFNANAADVNGDGTVNMKDVLTIRKYLANLIDHLGI